MGKPWSLHNKTICVWQNWYYRADHEWLLWQAEWRFQKVDLPAGPNQYYWRIVTFIALWVTLNEGVFNTFDVWNKRSSIFSKNADHHFMRCFKFSRAHNFQPMAFPREMGHFCTAGHSKRIRFKENCRLSEFHSRKIIAANSIQAFLPLILISLKIFFCILANEKSLSWKSSLLPWETVIER